MLLVGRDAAVTADRFVEPGDVVVLADGREALRTARVETSSGPLAALLEVVVPTRSSA
jgi:hypothetical protein